MVHLQWFGCGIAAFWNIRGCDAAWSIFRVLPLLLGFETFQAQFVIGMCHAAQSLYFGCNFIRWMHYALIFYGGTILILFLNFYYQAYIKAAKKRQV